MITITNDTTTLNGALAELGETMAENLVTMGVTDASASDGLTTLAGKILLVPQGSVTKTLTLTSDKSILSFYDSESAVLSATYTENGSPVENVTVEFFKGSTSLGTASTNSNGVATKSYSSAGVGDVSFTASVGSLVSETYVVEDCLFYGINTSAFIIPSNTTFTSDGTKITATTNTSGEKLVYFDHTFSNNDNWIFETEVAQIGTDQSIAVVWNDNSFWGGQTRNEIRQVYSTMEGEQSLWETVEVGKKFIITRENGVTTVSFNDKTVQSKTISHKSSFKVGYFINKNRVQYYKNIKIKAL